ncbi:hypothetical protein HY488_02650 [Candidatus Woesearchaeota archaeon]|nr:hypothetical protein [Candidatus Woesearchaeota archaeon]
MKAIDFLWKLKAGDKVRLGKGTFTIRRILEPKGKQDERLLDLGQGFFVILTKTGYKVGRFAPKGTPVQVKKIKKDEKK